MYVNRGHNSFKLDVGNNEVWKYYNKNYDVKVDRTKFFEIIREYNARLIDEMIFKNFDFRMPFNLGNLSIRKSKNQIHPTLNGTMYRNSTIIDWKATQELWAEMYPGKTMDELTYINNKKYVYHLNEHSLGYRYSFHWRKWSARVKNQSIYGFKLSKTNKTKIAQAIREHGKQLNHFLK